MAQNNNKPVLTEKDLKEIKFLELRKKEKENKPMTSEEINALQAYKTREVINQVLRVIGLVTALFLFVLTFDMFAEGTIWGLIFKNKDFIAFVNSEFGVEYSNTVSAYWGALYRMGSLKILEVIIGNETGCAVFGCMLMTAVHIALCVAIIYLLAYAIRDIINFVKRLFATPVKLIKDVSGTVKDSVDTVDQNQLDLSIKAGKKNLFQGADVDAEKRAEKQEKKKRRKEKTEDLEGYTQDELDRLLSGETPESKENQQEEEIKPLF